MADAPEQTRLVGMEKDFGAILENFVGAPDLVEINKERYKSKWREFLPVQRYNEQSKIIEVKHEEWSMAYVPEIVIRKVYDPNSGVSVKDPTNLENWRYFILVLNSSRDDRPQVVIDKNEDILQKNVLDKGMIITSTDNFYVCPNGFPYHSYASLMIWKEKGRRQEAVNAEDIIEFIKFSFLTEQFVFFNSISAGASRPERFHAQVVDPRALRFEGRAVRYPILTFPREHIKNGVYDITDYPTDTLVFIGKDAPYEASRIVSKLEDKGFPYNIGVRGQEVYVTGRNSKREKSDCIGKNLGGYECSGVVLVGNVEEQLLGDVGLLRMVNASKVFSELNYETLYSNISAASLNKGWLRDLL